MILWVMVMVRRFSLDLSVSICRNHTMMRLGSRLSTASSRSKGLLVEAITTTRSLVVRSPSHSCIKVVFTEVSVPWELSSPCSRDDSTESTYTHTS